MRMSNNLCFGQVVRPVRASHDTRSVFAEHFSSVHCNSARVLSAGRFCRRALYSPNFKASARCGAVPSSMPLMSSKIDVVVLSVFIFVPRWLHPIIMISGCLKVDLKTWRWLR